jgi:sigma-B regulation protein RsbU (phosphoserine phosphatase)
VLIYRCRKGIVEEVVQKTMPLGSFLDFPYTQERIDMDPGDTILFLSDGFTEAFNPEGDILGLQRAKEIFLSCAERNVEEIVECIRLEIELWQAGDPPKDDMTFVVVKKTKI